MVSGVAGYEDIIEPVIIIVAHRHSVSIAKVFIQSGPRGYIRESTVPIIVIQRTEGSVCYPGIRAGWPALDEEDVLPAIVIIIDKCAASRGAFNEVELVGVR